MINVHTLQSESKTHVHTLQSDSKTHVHTLQQFDEFFRNKWFESVLLQFLTM